MQLVEILKIILLITLIGCSVAVNLTPSLLQAVVIFMSYSSIMCIVWILLESPDLAITEAAVGAGISGTLFLMTLKKISAEDAGEIQDEKTGMFLTGISEDELDVFLVEEGGESTRVLLSGKDDKDAPLLRARESRSMVLKQTGAKPAKNSGEAIGHEPERMDN